MVFKLLIWVCSLLRLLMLLLICVLLCILWCVFLFVCIIEINILILLVVLLLVCGLVCHRIVLFFFAVAVVGHWSKIESDILLSEIWFGHCVLIRKLGLVFVLSCCLGFCIVFIILVETIVLLHVRQLLWLHHELIASALLQVNLKVSVLWSPQNLIWFFHINHLGSGLYSWWCISIN